MRHRSFILVAALVALLIFGAVGVYAYDSSREDTIAKGVTVAGVDVGGMKAVEARRVVRRRVVTPLDKPVAVAYKGRRWTLSARAAGLRADVDGMVDEAIRDSRSGNVVSRVARDVTGGEEDAQVPARVSYSKRAVARLVRRVEHGVNRRARDAKLDFPSLAQVKERNGVEVQSAQLESRLTQAIVTPGVDRQVSAPTRITKPKVTRAQLATRYPVLVTVDRANFQLRFFRHLRLVSSYPIAVGQQGLETPAGLYHVQNKAVNPAWHVPNSAWAGSMAGQVVPGGSAENPLKARWLGIFAGAGIHGTDELSSLGTAASHGCIRMAIPDVIALYSRVPVGAPVYIS